MLSFNGQKLYVEHSTIFCLYELYEIHEQASADNSVVK